MRQFKPGRNMRRDSRSGRDSEESSERPRGRDQSFQEFRERRGGKGNFRGNSRSRGSDRMEMHPAVCDECGKSCEVPFKPTSSKPIFCSECFEKKEKRGRGDDRRGGSGDLKPSLYELDVINRKLDKIMKKLGVE